MTYRRLHSLAAAAFVALALVALSPSSASAQSAAEMAQQPTYDPTDLLGAEGRPWTGSREPTVLIVMFSEFQCPFCARVAPTLEQLLADNDDVALVFRHLPLSFHDNAESAAVAAEAAWRQGAFWPFHDVLFDNQRSLNQLLYTATAASLELDMDRFQSDLADPDVLAIVRQDAAAAAGFGIRGTPNFLINGRPLTGAQPLGAFDGMVREERAAMQALIDDGMSRSEALGARIEANLDAAPAPAPRPAARPEPDPSVRMFVDISDRELRGADEPLVVITEFGEYQCPFCGRVEPTLDQILDRWGDDVAIAFYHNPLSFHDRAEPAARAALAAGMQGAFWPFHDALFDNQRDLSEARFRAIAAELGLDADQLLDDMDSAAVDTILEADAQEAVRLGASGTPHFFVNGQRLRGAQPFDAFERLIEQELETAHALLDQGVDREDVYATVMADAERGDAPMITPPAAPARAPMPDGPYDIDTTGAPTMGPDDAPVQFVVFSDFSCGYCAHFQTSCDAVLADLGDDVQFVFMHFVRGTQAHSADEARASQAAHLQGAFEAYQRALFEQGGSMTDDELIQLAEDLGLDVDQFNADRASQDVADLVDRHRAEGQRVGVRGTPTWFLNGERFIGAYDESRLRQALEEAIESAEE